MQKRLFLLAVALIILIPATGVFTGLGAMSEQEMHSFEGRKKATIEQDFPKWFADNLGVRELFLKTYASVLLFIFGQPTTPEQVQVGRNGFLFYGKTFSAHAGIPLAENVLQHLGEGFKAIITLFQEKGIPVLIAIAPDKATIYGEYYPKWVKHVSRSFPRDNFNASPLLQEHVLFLEDALLEYKKDSDFLYWKTDTHWNQMGAYLGYITLIDAIEKITQKKLERVSLLGFKTINTRRGDLERMNRIALTKDIIRDLLVNKTEYHPITVDKKENYSKFMNKNGLNSLNIVVVFDSFYSQIPHVYRTTFNTVYEIPFRKLDKATFEALLTENPPLDLLVVLLVERSVPGGDSRLKRLAKELSTSPS